jgi:hypothetical protein
VARAAQEAIEEASLRRSWRLIRVVLGALELLEVSFVEGRLLVSDLVRVRGVNVGCSERAASRFGRN